MWLLELSMHDGEKLAEGVFHRMGDIRTYLYQKWGDLPAWKELTPTLLVGNIGAGERKWIVSEVPLYPLGASVDYQVKGR